jgi:1,4-alpha-glucan branching enzyme
VNASGEDFGVVFRRLNVPGHPISTRWFIQMPALKVTVDELQRLINADHADPHSVLGIHATGDGKLILRSFHPEATGCRLIIKNKATEMQRIHVGGIFQVEIAEKELGRSVIYEYEFIFGDENTFRIRDPYRFPPLLGEQDLYFAAEGRHWKLYDKLGAHLKVMDGIQGVAFSVWAPNARRVSVVGDFNRWDGRMAPMRCMGNSGIWEVFLPGVKPGDLYKFEIKTQSGALLQKLDPYAFYTEMRPRTAAIVWQRGTYDWADQGWLKAREQRKWLNEPMSVYECHLGSWMRDPGNPENFLNYRDLAPMLAAHCQKYHFNFVEFMPLTEFPFDGSWGYQVVGYFAPTSRFGTPNDLKFMIDTLHQAGIGVIMDWVPAHFPKDAHGLANFDGTCLYEHADPRKGEHMDWGTKIFNFGRNEVSNFLISSALFWIDEYHVDGLRVDAVASMLYLDYSRGEGEWVPNMYGGRENLEAISFLRHLNEEVHGQYKGAFTVAEESTSFPGVSRPLYVGGLGFTFKWNMGWMNDSLEFFSKDPIYRSHHHNDLTFSMIYAYTENFMLPISHDEVVHGKGSLLAKMPGDDWTKFANYRLFMGYMFTHPGKKLLFQGCEFAQGGEWRYNQSLDWHECGFDNRKHVEHLMMDLGRVYSEQPALWKYDHEPRGFTWIDCTDWQSSVLSFIRWGENGDHVIVVCNFTPVLRKDYRIGVPLPAYYEEILNTDSAIYGGSNHGNNGGLWADHWAMHGHYHSLNLNIPPLSCLIFKPRN